MSDRICVQCEHFYFSMGSRAWSEITPGEDAFISCQKDHWSMSNDEGEGSRERFRLNIAKAKTCADFEPAEDK